MYQMLHLARGGKHNHMPYRSLWSCVRPRVWAVCMLVNVTLCQTRDRLFFIVSYLLLRNVSSGNARVVLVRAPGPLR